MNVFELFGTIAINNENANKALTDTGKLANGLSNAMEAAFGKLQGTARKIGTTIATVFAVDKIKDFGQSCAEVYASVAAEESAFAQIMGDYATMATEKMNEVADSTGVVATRLTPYMTSMTAKFKGLGFQVDEATSLAAEGLTIASDAAAFWDKSLDESMSHLNSFINGSYEGGEAIGLFANDTQMAAYAVEQGIVAETKAWSKLDEATKQSTRMRYAKEMMASSGATGQAAIEAENFANVQANLNEQFRQFQSVIGEPIMNNIMLPAMRRVSQYMPKITDNVTTFIKTYSEGFKKFASQFSAIFKEDGIDLSALPGAISSAIASIWPKVQEKCRIHLGIELPEWADIESNITTWWTNTKRSIDNICTWALQLPNNPDGSVDQIALTVKGWWDSTALPAIQSVSGWALQLFGHPVEDEATIKQHVEEWWKIAGEAVASACTWTLKLFDMPDESAEAIGEKVKTWWNSVLGAVDKETWSAFFADFSTEAKEGLEDANSIFGLALDAISGLAEIGTEAVTGSLEWIKNNGKATAIQLEALAVGFMLAAAAAHPYATAIVLAAGALGLMAEYGGADRYDHFFDGYSNEDLAKLQEYVDVAKEVQAAQQAVNDALDRGEDGIAEDGAVRAAQARMEAIKAEINEGLLGVYNSWNEGQNGWQQGMYFDIPVRTAEESEANIQGELDAMTFEKSVQMLADASGIQTALNQSMFTAYANVVPIGSATSRWFNSVLPGHATGLDEVPFDNYIARLHKGEAVLTSSQAEAWRSGSMNTGRMEALLGQMMTIMQQVAQNTSGGKQVVLDSGVLVGQLAPALDTQLGTISIRKGRRN